MPEQDLSKQTEIWRYMDLERFVTMLVAGAIRFTKAAEFHDDPWEGFCKVILPDTPIPAPDADGLVRLYTREQIIASVAQAAVQYLEHAHKFLYVTSWSLRKDSMAMWKIYGSNGRGVAIQSSVELFENALRIDLTDDHYRFGRVHYVRDIQNAPEIQEDFRQSAPFPGPDLRRIVTSKAFVKRWAYEYENEWRGAVYQDPRDIKGLDIPINLDVLIDAVYLGPQAPDFMKGVVEDLMKKFGIEKTVVRSNLLVEPPSQRHVLSTDR